MKNIHYQLFLDAIFYNKVKNISGTHKLKTQWCILRSLGQGQGTWRVNNAVICVLIEIYYILYNTSNSITQPLSGIDIWNIQTVTLKN